MEHLVETKTNAISVMTIFPVNEVQGLININGADDALGTVPILYRIQQKKKEKLEVGLFSTGTKQVKEIAFVMLAMSHSRSWFQKYDVRSPKQILLCASTDGKFPDRGTSKQAGPCNECALSKWNHGAPPECSESFNMLGFDWDDKLPFILQIRRTAITNFRRFRTEIKAKGLPHFCFLAKITLELREIPSLHYVPVFGIQRVLTEQEAQEMFACAKIFAGDMHASLDQDGQDGIIENEVPF